MCDNSIKKWTVLIYADGNNEMEEVIYKSFLACEKIGSSDDVNIVIQIGKMGNYKNNEKDSWSGVRRYYVENGDSTLIEDLGKANMASPNVLYDFIKWGFENYKAENVMLVLSDHGGDFIGCFTDLTLDVPYIMGIPEMIEAINEVGKNFGYIIDILLLDMCHMNCVEVLYELGQEENSTVKTVLTYMDYAVYEGITYSRLLSTTEKYSNITDLNLFIKHLIDNQDFNLISYEINNTKLEEIKLLFSDWAEKGENPLYSIKASTVIEKDLDYINNINEKLKSIVIYSKKEFKGINLSINITSIDVGHLIYFYSKLAFSKNNSWKNLLRKKIVNNLPVLTDRINVSSSNSLEPKIHYILKLNKNNL